MNFSTLFKNLFDIENNVLSPQELTDQIDMSRAMCLVIAVLGTISLLITLDVKDPKPILSALILYSWVYYFWAHKYRGWLSRMGHIILGVLAAMGAACFTGPETGFQYLLICTWSSAAIFFSPKEVSKIVLSTIIVIVAFTLLEVSNYSILRKGNISLSQREFLNSMSVLGAYFLLMGETLVFVLWNEKRNRKLINIEWKLKQRQYVLDELQQVGDIGYWEYFPKTHTRFWSDRVFEIFGLPKGRYLSLKEMKRIFEPESHELVMKSLMTCASYGVPFDIKLSLVTEKGEKRWVRSVGKSIKVEGKEPWVAGVFQDITEEQTLQIEKEQKRKLLTRIAENTPVGFFQLVRKPNGDYRVPFISSKMAGIWGIDSTVNYHTKDFLLDVLEEDRESVKTAIEKSFESNLPWNVAYRISVRGRIRWIRTVAEPQREKDGLVSWDGVLFEITEQKQLEESVQKERARAFTSSKLAALGQMAGGIAHELNNPLAIIDGYASRIQNRIHDGTINRVEGAEMVDRIIVTGKRMTRVVKGLRKISRDGSQDAQEIHSLKEIIDDALSLCVEKFRNQGILFRFNEAEKDVSVYCRSTEISQVVLSLLNNAYDAVEKRKGDRWIEMTVQEDNGRVYVFVRDSGFGIPSAHRRRLFEPFFTTKSTGTSTGLGLSVARQIMRHHGGDLSLASDSHFTELIMELPVTRVKIVSNNAH